MNVLGVASSGFALQARRIEVSAHNVANVSTEGFRASSVRASERAGGGVSAEVVQGNEPTDQIREAVTQIEAVGAYRANGAVARTASEMQGTLVDLLA